MSWNTSYLYVLIWNVKVLFLILTHIIQWQSPTCSDMRTSVGNSHRSASPRPTTLEEDREIFVDFSSILCLWIEIQGMRTYNFFDWVSNTDENKHKQKYVKLYKWYDILININIKKMHQLLNLRALKISMLYKIHAFQCLGRIFCVEFQRETLKFHTKYHAQRCASYF